MKKEEIRRRVKAQKSLLTAKERSDAANDVFRRLERTAAFCFITHCPMSCQHSNS